MTERHLCARVRTPSVRRSRQSLCTMAPPVDLQNNRHSQPAGEEKIRHATDVTYDGKAQHSFRFSPQSWVVSLEVNSMADSCINMPHLVSKTFLVAVVLFSVLIEDQSNGRYSHDGKCYVRLRVDATVDSAEKIATAHLHLSSYTELKFYLFVSNICKICLPPTTFAVVNRLHNFLIQVPGNTARSKVLFMRTTDDYR